MKTDKLIKGMVGLVACGWLLISACTSSDERAQQEAADQEAAQIEGKLPDPVAAARTEAGKFLADPNMDSVRMQTLLRRVSDLKTRYETEDGSGSAVMFDSVFISTLNTVNPQLCAEIKNKL